MKGCKLDSADECYKLLGTALPQPLPLSFYVVSTDDLKWPVHQIDNLRHPISLDRAVILDALL